MRVTVKNFSEVLISVVTLTVSPKINVDIFDSTGDGEIQGEEGRKLGNWEIRKSARCGHLYLHMRLFIYQVYYTLKDQIQST